MVSDISKDNRVIVKVFILLVSIGGFFDAVNYFSIFLVSLRVTKTMSFQVDSFLRRFCKGV